MTKPAQPQSVAVVSTAAAGSGPAEPAPTAVDTNSLPPGATNTIAEAQTKLAQLLDLAQAGHEVIIEDPMKGKRF